MLDFVLSPQERTILHALGLRHGIQMWVKDMLDETPKFSMPKKEMTPTVESAVQTFTAAAPSMLFREFNAETSKMNFGEFLTTPTRPGSYYAARSEHCKLVYDEIYSKFGIGIDGQGDEKVWK